VEIVERVLDGGQVHVFGLERVRVGVHNPRDIDDAKREEHDVHAGDVGDGQVQFVGDKRAEGRDNGYQRHFVGLDVGGKHRSE